MSIPKTLVWEHGYCITGSCDGIIVKSFPHPSKSADCIDDMRKWPSVSYGNIFNYCVLTVGVSGEKMNNYKGFDSYKFFHGNKVGKILLNSPEDGYVFLVADVNPSQSVHDTKHRAWVLTTSYGRVETAGCTCIAGLGQSCSHAVAILWKNMAEHAANLTSATNADRPSVFEVLAQESLMTTVRPAGKHAVRVLAESRPERFGWLLRWYDEIYTLFDLVLQHHYLSHYSASFAENFYDLKRVCTEDGSSQQLSKATKWKSLMLLVFVPYLKIKLDQTFEDLKYREDTLPRRDNAPLKVRMSRAFLALYPYTHMAWEGAALCHTLAYTFHHSRWHSLLLRLSGTQLRHSSGEDQSDDKALAAWETAKQQGLCGSVWRGALQGTAAVVSTGLSGGVFFLQFLDWWYNSDSSAPALTAMPTPTPPQREGGESSAPHSCPLCHRLRTNETALSVSGYVFCFPCIHEYLQKHRCCPVTGYPAKTEHLIKIYQPDS